MSAVITTTAMSTTIVELMTSLRVGQATLRSSPLTSEKYSRGPTLSRSNRRRLSLALLRLARLVLALLLHHALGLTVHRHGTAVLFVFTAGQEGLEPATAGFGDRCSTN